MPAGSRPVSIAEVESSEGAGNAGAARINDRSSGPDVKEPDVFERDEVRERLVREPAVRKGGAMRCLGPATWAGRRPEWGDSQRHEGVDETGVLSAVPACRSLPRSGFWCKRAMQTHHEVLALYAGFRRTTDAGVATT